MTDQEKIKNLDHRIRKLMERLSLQKDGSLEVLTTQRILEGLQEKKKQLLSGQTFIPEITSVRRSDGMTEEDLYQRLGLIYLIFGPSYEETFSYHTYRIEFLYLSPKPDNFCVMTVVADIFEDDQLLSHLAYIDFWKEHPDDNVVTDIGISYWDDSIHTKYKHHFHWFSKLAVSLAQTWNQYHRNISRLVSQNGGIHYADTEKKS